MDKSTIDRAIELVRGHHGKELYVQKDRQRTRYCMIGAMLVADGARVVDNGAELTVDLGTSNLSDKCKEATRLLGFESSSEAFAFNDYNDEATVVERMERASLLQGMRDGQEG